MKMQFHIVIFPIIVLFLNTSASLVNDSTAVVNDSSAVYLVKNNWHTGIVLKVDEVINYLPEIKEFAEFRYVDIGWGDMDFYQHQGFDAGLAVKALFYPTPSAIRVEGFSYAIDRYIELSDMAAVIGISEEQLENIALYISDAFEKDEKGSLIQLSSMYGGNIRFYKAEGEYHLFNTCNTWAAAGIRQGGVEIKDYVILAEQLFKEAAGKGKILKSREDQEE